MLKLSNLSNCCVAVLLVVLSAAGVIQAASLPDTGQSLCYDGSAMVACTESNTGDSANYPGQDGRFGRDAAATAGQLSKNGGGEAGYDYTKVCASGELAGQGSCPENPALGSGANDWACTIDNITDLIWEVKTDDGGLRDKDWRYHWYNSDNTSNGGNPGQPDDPYYVSTCYDAGRCDTEKYTVDVNSADLCGETNDDWRLPSKRELETLLHGGTQSPLIDDGYFPNTESARFVSSTTSVMDANPVCPSCGKAFVVKFDTGVTYADSKDSTYYVRLVRGGQF